MDGMQREVRMWGISHHTASTELRGALSFDAADTHELLRLVREPDPEVEAMVLSTCNRSELYIAAPDAERALCVGRQALFTLRPAARAAEARGLFVERSGTEAARHLVRVAAGLDSAVLGEQQVLGQVREASSAAREDGALGPVLGRLADAALRAGARVRAETDLAHGGASTGGAVVRALRHEYGTRGKPRVLLIGAGRAAESVARHLMKASIVPTITNRTDERAARLATELSGAWAPYEKLRQLLAEHEVVVAATGAEREIVNVRLLEGARALGGVQVVVDLGVPANVAVSAEVERWDVDRLRELRDRTLELRERAIPDAERIVDEELAKWGQWHRCMPLDRALRQLFGKVDELSREAALELRVEDSAGAERVVKRAMKRLLHEHVRQLRELSAVGAGAR